MSQHQNNQPAPVTYYRPVCQQSWSQGLLLHRTSPSHFFPSSGRSHSQYSLLRTHGGMARAESTWVPRSVSEWFTRPKAVTHPGTNRAQRRVTVLNEYNALPLRHAGTFEQWSVIFLCRECVQASGT